MVDVSGEAVAMNKMCLLCICDGIAALSGQAIISALELVGLLRADGACTLVMLVSWPTGEISFIFFILVMLPLGWLASDWPVGWPVG